MDDDSQSTIKSEIGKAREELHKTKLDRLRENMTNEQQKTNELIQRPYNCLISLPLMEHNYNLNKQQFLDALRIRTGHYQFYQRLLYVDQVTTYNIHCPAKREV